MSEMDPLRAVLREWKAPEPSEELDRRVLEGFRAAGPRSLWKRFWAARVSVPVPVLAAAVLVVGMIWALEFRPAPPAEAPGVVTRLAASGFQPLPNGIAQVEDVKQ